MTSTRLIFLLLSTEIADCHATLKTKEVSVVPLADARAHAAPSRRLLAKTFVSRNAFPFRVPQLQKSLSKGFSNDHYGRRIQTASSLFGLGASPLQTSPFLVPQLQKSAYKGPNLITRFPDHQYGRRVTNPRDVTAASLFGLGPAELLVIGAVALFFFGPESLPTVGKQLGGAVRGLKEASKEFSDTLKEDTNSTTPSPTSI